MSLKDELAKQREENKQKAADARQREAETAMSPFAAIFPLILLGGLVFRRFTLLSF